MLKGARSCTNNCNIGRLRDARPSGADRLGREEGTRSICIHFGSMLEGARRSGTSALCRGSGELVCGKFRFDLIANFAPFPSRERRTRSTTVNRAGFSLVSAEFNLHWARSFAATELDGCVASAAQ